VFDAPERGGLVRPEVRLPELNPDVLVRRQRIWRIHCDDLLLQRMSAAEPADEPEPLGTELTLADLRGNDLFSWFNLSEGRRYRPAPT